MSKWSSNRRISGSLCGLCVVAFFLSSTKAQQVTANAPFTYPLLASSSFCAALGSGGSATCGASPAGFVAIPASATVLTLAVDTMAVTSHSQIFIQYDETVSITGVTCNTGTTTRQARYLITGRV